VPTDQLLVYAVRLRLLKMRTLYTMTQKNIIIRIAG
jgi:hypothetical protein